MNYTPDIPTKPSAILDMDSEYYYPQLIILSDIGDYWTIGVSGNYKSILRDIPSRLYQEIDEKVIPEVIEHKVSSLQSVKTLREALATILPKTPHSQCVELEKMRIRQDIASVFEYCRVVDRYRNQVTTVLQRCGLGDPQPSYARGKSIACGETDWVPYSQKNIDSLSFASSRPEPRSPTPYPPASSRTFKQKGYIQVLYNTIFNVSLVYQKVIEEDKESDSEYEIDRCDELCKAHPDFVIVCSLYAEGQNFDLLCKLFHKTVFETESDARMKAESFITLFDAGFKGSADTKPINQLKRIMETHFDLSDDVNRRMKATELFGSIVPLIDSGENFRIQLPGLLLQLGLQKKRMKDGQYYYGIQRKVCKTPKAQVLTDFETELSKRHLTV